METQSSDSAQQQQKKLQPDVQAKQIEPGRKRRWLIGGALSLALICAALTVLAWKKVVEARGAEGHQLAEEHKRAKQAQETAKAQLDHEEAARQTAEDQRRQALAAEKEARRSEQVAKAVVAFLQKYVLSSGNDKGWGSTAAGKDVTLRQAVNKAEPKVAGMFVDKPLVEASIRQIFGATYLDLGDAARSVQQLERALELREYELGPDHPDTNECRNKLAVAYRRAGRPDDAAALYQQNRLSTSHAAALAIRGTALLAESKPIEAESKLRQSLELRQRIQPDDWTTFDVQSMLGAALLEQKKYAAAEPLLVSGYEGMKRRESRIPATDRSHLTRAHERLVHLYEAWGKPDQAEKWRMQSEKHETAQKP